MKLVQRINNNTNNNASSSESPFGDSSDSWSPNQLPHQSSPSNSRQAVHPNNNHSLAQEEKKYDDQSGKLSLVIPQMISRTETKGNPKHGGAGRTNYLLAKDKTPTIFVLDLGCKINVDQIRLVNTHNRWATKQFK